MCLALIAAAPPALERREIGDLLLEDIPAEAYAYGEAVNDYVDTRASYDFLGWRVGSSGFTLLRLGDLFTAQTPYGPFQRVIDLPQRIEDPLPALVCGQAGFVFSSDENGDEYDVVYAASPSARGFEAVAISPPDARNAGVRVSPNGALSAYASAARGQGEWALIAQAPCPNAPARVLERSTHRIHVEDVSSSGRIIVSRHDGEAYQLYAVNAQTGARTELARLDQPVRQAFAIGNEILFTTDAWSAFVELYAVSIRGGRSRRLLGDFGGDIERVALARDRSKLALILNENGLSRVLVLNSANMQALGAGLSRALGVILEATFTHDGAQLALKLNRDAAPLETGLYDWTQEVFTPWSGGVTGAGAQRIVRPVSFSYPSAGANADAADAAQIQALLYRPQGASAATPAPVVIAAHGGPSSQWRATFSPLHNYYVSALGVAVVLPNIRGSTGYGREFEQMDDGLNRRHAIADIGALMDWIQAQPELDAERVVIAGGSYGGYIALASLAAYPERLRGAISRVGIADIASFLANTEPYRVANRRLEYGDERDPHVAAELARISPLAQANAMRAPILVIHGANDPRVPLQQAEAIIAAVRANGRRAGFIRAGDEGHRFEAPANRRWRDGAQVDFVRRTLLEDPGSSGARR